MFSHETLKLDPEFFNNIQQGIIEDNRDPLQLGRCKVRISGIHTELKTKSATEGIPTEELPWAVPMLPITGGAISGLGENGVPVNGSLVAVFFINGNHNRPVYFGCIPGYPTTAADTSKGFSDPDGVYPKTLNEPDWNKYARGSVVDHGTQVGVEPSNPSSPEYPYNHVFETPDNGIIVEHDSTPGAERWHIFHKASKSYMQIGPDGTTVFKSTKDNYSIVVSNNNIHIGGNETKTIEGNLTKTIEGNLTKTIEGNLTINISGTATINATGKTTVNGSTIELIGASGTPKGIVQGDCICPITGVPHFNISNTVKGTL